MNTIRQTIPIWGILSAALILVTALSAILATGTLDAVVVRPEPASINTLLPGWTYAAASVMKVCLGAGAVLAVIALVNRARLRWLPVIALATTGASDDRQENTPNPATILGKIIPVWSVLSVALTPLTPLIGALAVVVAQAFVGKSEGIAMSDFPLISRTGVLVMLAWIAAGMVAGLIALLKRERPRSLSLFGVVTNVFLIGLFWYFEFYKLGFDQDRWAAP